MWLLAVSSIPSRGSVPKFEDEHHCLVHDDRAPHVSGTPRSTRVGRACQEALFPLTPYRRHLARLTKSRSDSGGKSGHGTTNAYMSSTMECVSALVLSTCDSVTHNRTTTTLTTRAPVVASVSLMLVAHDRRVVYLVTRPLLQSDHGNRPRSSQHRRKLFKQQLGTFRLGTAR